MASAAASEYELADLPGEELVLHLLNTYHRADFEAVARVLHARDLRNAQLAAELRAALADLEAATARGSGDAEVSAELKAALKDIEAVRDKYKALLDALLRPQDEVEEIAAPMAGAAAPVPARQEDPRPRDQEAKEADIIDLCSSDEEEEEERPAGGCEEQEEDDDGDEEDTEPLSQRFKRLRRLEPGELESGRGDVRGPTNSVVASGSDQQKSSSVWVEVQAATAGKMVSAKPEDSKVKREMRFLPSTVTSNWRHEAQVFNAMFNDDNGELTMQALCALYRQGKLAMEDKRKESRAKKLAQFLLDGDVHGPVKRTAEELKKKDGTNALFLREVTTGLSEQLFGIFMTKEDPYFC